MAAVFSDAEKIKPKEGRFYETREEIKRKCNYITCLSADSSRGGKKLCNKFIIDQSDMLLVIWNGKKEGNTWKQIKEAQEKGKKIEYIMLSEL